LLRKIVRSTLLCMTEGSDSTSQWLRGVLDLCLMGSLVDEPRYGYEMTSQLAASGLDAVAEGSIYPALARLERAGLIEGFSQAGSGGPPRKYYRLTANGRVVLARRGQQWRQFARAVDKVLPPATKKGESRG
jgi:PadR family transcriptional regulator PadR